ncbi:hypothetical protein [Mesorhizobium sp. ES1-1]|uniref:hypothetical protein n=1 Tax=Mesorhizobium sp. ES1-1 TaxID=2876629 RepID=UPI001CCDE945|nr:hypothetical protein [Mesorhizobium sp. ES1-1]MBZ9678922.1 hypothetical protein [Mesorhizobium sp. ES1-1]
MPASEAIRAAVSQIDMIELCSRIVTNPERNAPKATVAEIYALARATEGLWAIALDAKLLISALGTGNHHEVVLLSNALREQLNPLSPIPTRKEIPDANSN